MASQYQMSVEESREFRSQFFKIIIPLLLSSVFTQSLTFIDQWMVSTLGATAIAAVGVSSNYYSIYMTFLYGCNMGAGIYMTRYWGRQDIPSFQKIYWCAMFTTFTVSIVFCGIPLLFPEFICHFFTRDPAVIAQAIPYMRIVAVSNILNSLTSTMSFTFRNIGAVKVPMLQGIYSLLGNVFFNYVFIFGAFIFPKMGVTGAALGTLVTRIGEVALLFLYFYCSGTPIAKNVSAAIHKLNRRIFIEFLKTSLPMSADDMLWSLGISIYYMVYGTRGTEVYAAMSIMQTMQMISKLAIMGFCSTCTVMLGMEIGRGDRAKIDRYAFHFNRISLIAGFISCGIILVLIYPMQFVYGIRGTYEGECVMKCMIVLSIYIIMNALNSIKIEGIFRSGGDIAYLTFMDAGSIWIVGLPVTLIAGLLLNLPIWYVYTAHIWLELFKIPFGEKRLKSGKWLHNITKKIDEAA